MDLREREKLFRRTNEALANAPLLLVEGLRDERALREMGFQSPVLRANDKPERVAQRVLELTPTGEPVLLFDFDHEGERKLRDYRQALESAGARCDGRLRLQLKWLTGQRHIEDLPPAWEELREGFARGSRERVSRKVKNYGKNIH